MTISSVRALLHRSSYLRTIGIPSAFAIISDTTHPRTQAKTDRGVFAQQSFRWILASFLPPLALEFGELAGGRDVGYEVLVEHEMTECVELKSVECFGQVDLCKRFFWL